MCFDPQVADSWFGQQEHRLGFGIGVGLQHPESRGTIRLRSGNPFHQPVINPQYLHDDRDVEHLLHGEYLFLLTELKHEFLLSQGVIMYQIDSEDSVII